MFVSVWICMSIGNFGWWLVVVKHKHLFSSLFVFISIENIRVDGVASGGDGVNDFNGNERMFLRIKMRCSEKKEKKNFVWFINNIIDK